MTSRSKAQSGFTLPELLVVGGVLLVFLVIGAVLINPKDESAGIRNAERRLELAQLAQAINRYVSDNGQLPSGISGEEQFIGGGEEEADLCGVLVPNYAKDLPFDPLSQVLSESTNCPDQDGDYITAYAIKKSGNTFTLTAPLTEVSEQQIELSFSY